MLGSPSVSAQLVASRLMLTSMELVMEYKDKCARHNIVTPLYGVTSISSQLSPSEQSVEGMKCPIRCAKHAQVEN